jgi:hypothetical protein
MKLTIYVILQEAFLSIRMLSESLAAELEQERSNVQELVKKGKTLEPLQVKLLY